MKVFRRVLFWTHLAAGLTAGIVVAIMSITGFALTYQRQMQTWADRGDWRPAAGAVRLTPDALAGRIRAANPDATLTSLTIRAATSDLASAALSTNGTSATLQIDPTSGVVVPQGRWSASMRATFRTMTDWHRWLGRTGDARTAGRWITGASNLIFLFLVLSGVYLWWPRQITRRAFAAVLRFRGGLTSKARDFNWHNVIGFWCALPLAAVVASGTVISYPWASNLVYRIAGEAPPGPAVPRTAPARSTGPTIAAAEPLSLDAVVSTTTTYVADWRSLSIRLPASSSAPVVVTIDRGTGGQPQHRDTLTLDAQSCDVLKWEPFAGQSTGRRWRSYMRFAHTGEVFGLTGQTIAGVASGGSVVLVWTGIALALRRLGAWITRRGRAPR